MRFRLNKTKLRLLLFIGFVSAVQIGYGGSAMAQMDDRSARLAKLVSEYPLLDDDGKLIPNHRVKLAAPIDAMPGVVVAANPEGKTTVAEFYDLNCPFCRIASGDIADIVSVDPDLRLVLVPFPVLGASSIAASRVELAVARLSSPKQFYKFQHAIYAEQRGTNRARALEVVRKRGLDEAAVAKLSDSDEITKILKEHVTLGKSLGLVATPSFVIDNVAIIGYPGRHSLQTIVDAVRSCGRVYCQD